MFTTSCFIRKNTLELRNKLLKIGHTLCRCTEFEDADWLSVSNNNDLYRSVHGLGYTDETINMSKEDLFNNFLSNTNHIDCGTNEELFLAIAALRDDTDKNQWFTSTNDYWYKCLDNKFSKKTANWVSCASADKWHKATVEEITEHFKYR